MYSSNTLSSDFFFRTCNYILLYMNFWYSSHQRYYLIFQKSGYTPPFLFFSLLVPISSTYMNFCTYIHTPRKMKKKQKKNFFNKPLSPALCKYYNIYYVLQYALEYVLVCSNIYHHTASTTIILKIFFIVKKKLYLLFMVIV